MGALERALDARDEGNYEGAVAKLAKLSSSKSEDASAATYELAMMLHALGRHSEADKAARSLGFKHRLNDEIFSGGKDIEAREDGGIHAAVFDAALGEELLAGLREVFGTGSSFWTKHEYPTDGFFSYNAPISHSTQKVDKKATQPAKKKSKTEGPPPPGGNLMRLLAQRLTTLAKPIIGDGQVESFEFWAHSRSGSCPGHQLHFDLDEERVKKGEGHPHPLASCVVYVGGGGEGHPTLVTDLRVDGDDNDGGSGKGATKGWLCPPEDGRVLVFDGALMHGVCPILGGSSSGSEPRTTVMVGLWGRGVTTVPGQPAGKLAPNMRSVHARVDGDWNVRCNSQIKATSGEGEQAKRARGLVPVGKVWQKISGGGKEKRNDGKGGGNDGDELVDVGRFMIRVEPKNVRSLCAGEIGASAKMGEGAVTSITMEELMRLRAL